MQRARHFKIQLDPLCIGSPTPEKVGCHSTAGNVPPGETPGLETDVREGVKEKLHPRSHTAPGICIDFQRVLVRSCSRHGPELDAPNVAMLAQSPAGSIDLLRRQKIAGNEIHLLGDALASRGIRRVDLEFRQMRPVEAIPVTQPFQFGIH